MTRAPLRWWAGPLDAEGLAWSSVTAARDATGELCRARGLTVEVGTRPALVASAFAAIEHLRVDGREAQGWAPLSGFFPTAEGWVRLHGNYPHHAAAITRATGASTREELTGALAERTALEVEDYITAEHGIAVAVRTSEQWQAHPHGAATADEPWVLSEPGGERAPLSPDPTAPMAGVRVLDLTRVIAGPTCSQLLACLGADVLRIDPPGRPELLDQHLSNGMGKRSAELDLQADGEAVRALLPRADVVLVGYRPGSMAHFGLDPGTLAAEYPHLVVASLSAWGESGPWAQRPGFDSIVQAATGIAVRCGDGERPGALPVQALDHSTGYVMAAEVLRHLARARAGIVRVSLLGAARTLLAAPAPTDEPVEDLPIERVEVDSPHGHLGTTPPPLTLDGATIERPVSGYGAAMPEWVG